MFVANSTTQNRIHLTQITIPVKEPLTPENAWYRLRPCDRTCCKWSSKSNLHDKRPPSPTLPVVLLVEQREDLDVPLPQVLHVVLQSLLAVLHAAERHERLAAGTLQRVLTDHHRRLARGVAWNLQRGEEGGNVAFGGLGVILREGCYGVRQSAEFQCENVVLLDAVEQYGFLLHVTRGVNAHEKVALGGAFHCVFVAVAGGSWFGLEGVWNKLGAVGVHAAGAGLGLEGGVEGARLRRLRGGVERVGGRVVREGEVVERLLRLEGEERRCDERVPAKRYVPTKR